MLPTNLTSAYLQYKGDTDEVASWLATTAKACGYAVDLLTQTTKTGSDAEKQQKPSGRLKGKARKAAKVAQKPPSTASQAPTSQQRPTYTIATKDFVNLAEWLASYNKPPVRVPSSFVTILARAISVRRSYGQSLPNKSKSAEPGHSYFIGILEQVRDTLRPRFPVELTKTEDIGKEENTLNRFEGLELQEPSAEFLQAPDLTMPASAPPADTGANYEAERMQDMEEASIAFHLLFEDYHSFRTLVQKTWLGYRQGLFDLVSASIMTNTALDLARRLEQDAKPLLDKFGGPEQMLKITFLALCMEKGEDEGFKEQPQDDMNFRMWEASSAIFWPTYQILKAFVPMVDERHIPQYKPSFYGVYDPTSDRETKTPREKFKEDKIVLMEHLGEFALLCMGADKIAAEDELIRCLRAAFKSHEISLALVFATQVYLDIHHVLRDGVSRGFADLENTARLISNSLEQNFKHHQSLRVDTWPRSNDDAFKDIQQQIDHWVRNDPLNEAKARMNRPLGEPFKLLSSHPLFCGLFAYNLKVRYQEVGVAFVNAWGSLMYSYHLYNAAQQEHLLRNKWKDMELVMGLQGDVFVGDRPRSAADYFKRFTLSTGLSATAFAKGRRRGPLQKSARGPRGLKELAPVARMFKSRFCEGSGQTDLTLEDIEMIVSKSDWHDKELEEGLHMLSLTRTGKKTQATPTSAQRKTRRQLNAIELLERLRNVLLGETLEINIDYLALHRVVWLMLRSINEHCLEDLRQIHGYGYIEEENQLPFVVGYIFMAATKPQTEVARNLLAKAASVMDSYIGVAGDFLCRLLQEQHNIHAMEEADDEDEDENA